MRAEQRRICSAIVYAADEILFAAASDSPEALVCELAEWIVARAHDRLWPADAERVCVLARARRPREAIQLYFASVGRRWDEEWLVER